MKLIKTIFVFYLIRIYLFKKMSFPQNFAENNKKKLN
jgi:hypothetical protein